VGAAGEEEEVGFQKGRGSREGKETEDEEASAPRVIVLAATDGCDASAVGAVFWCCVPRFWWRGCVTASPPAIFLIFELFFNYILRIDFLNLFFFNHVNPFDTA
jgi:hypothetical protein